MKVIRLFLKSAGIFISLLLMAATGLIAANPTYICEIRNDYQIDEYNYEFDVYLIRTGTDELEYNSFQFGIKLDAGARNGGTITATFAGYVAGPPPSNPNYEVTPLPLPNKLTWQVAKNCITLTATPGGGAGANAANVIPNTEPGRKLGRYHLTNTVPFGQVQPNLTWTWTVATGYPTKLNAYVPYPGGAAAEITVQASHGYNLTNLVYNRFI